MLPLPYPAPYGWLLYALLGLDLLLLASGLALGRYDARQKGRLPLAVRMALSADLLVAAFVQRQLAGGGPLASYARAILLGMTLGFLGDLIMARLIPTPDRLIFGMLAFGLGHVAYLAALGGLTMQLGLWRPRVNVPVWALLLVTGLVLWQVFVQRPKGSRQLNLAALVYSLLMASVNAFATGLGIAQARFIPLALGAALFLASDLVLGNWNIRGHVWKGANDVVWITYNLGQLLIVYSVAATANVLLAG